MPAAYHSIAPQMRLSFQKQQFAAREDALLDAVNVLLAKKGFDLMTMDDVAAEVGIAKGSLYKHFASKESLAAAALCRMTRDTIAIVTARNAPAHERVVHTLRAWGTPADEAHFVGSHEKAPILRATRAHIFFDDQEKHFHGASRVVASGLVPGPHEPNRPVIPSSA